MRDGGCENNGESSPGDISGFFYKMDKPVDIVKCSPEARLLLLAIRIGDGDGLSPEAEKLIAAPGFDWEMLYSRAAAHCVRPQLEAFLKKAEDLVMRMAKKDAIAGVPATLHGKPEAVVLFRNLATIPVSTFKCPADDEERARLALELDLAMREKAPAGWKGDDTREKQVLNALFPLLSRDRIATQAIFEIVKHQGGY